MAREAHMNLLTGYEHLYSKAQQAYLHSMSVKLYDVQWNKTDLIPREDS